MAERQRHRLVARHAPRRPQRLKMSKIDLRASEWPINSTPWYRKLACSRKVAVTPTLAIGKLSKMPTTLNMERLTVASLLSPRTLVIVSVVLLAFTITLRIIY